MAFCNKCGTQLNASVKSFCPACGAPVSGTSVPSTQLAPSEPIAPLNPTAVPNPDQFSGETEIKQTQEVFAQDTATQAPRPWIPVNKTSGTGGSASAPGIKIIIAAVLLIAVVGGGYFIWDKYYNGKNDPAEMAVNEGKAIETLEILRSAQIAYTALNDGRLGTIDDLVQRALISNQFVSESGVDGYRYTTETSGTTVIFIATPTTAGSTGRYRYSFDANNGIRYLGLAEGISAKAPLCGDNPCNPNDVIKDVKINTAYAEQRKVGASKNKGTEEAEIASQQQAKAKADEEAKIVAAQQQAKAKADEEARLAAAQQQAKAKADEEARLAAAQKQAKAKADEETRLAAAQQQAKAKAEEEARLAAQTAVLPAGTPINIITSSEISTKDGKTGDGFTALLNEDILAGGRVVARRGSTVNGLISESDPGGRVKGVAVIALKLTGLTLSDGSVITVNTTEHSKDAPSSVGKDAAKTGIGAGIGAAIGGILGGGRGAAIGAGAGGAAGAGAVLATRGDPAVIAPETVITFNLTAPVSVTLK